MTKLLIRRDAESYNMKTNLNQMTPYILSNGHHGCTQAEILDMQETIERLRHELAVKDGHADELCKAIANLTTKLEGDLSVERALTDRLAGCINQMVKHDVIMPYAHLAIAAWNDSRANPRIQ